MMYSLVSLVALFVTIAINFQTLFSKKYREPGNKVLRAYRFLMAVAAFFFVFDALWGFLDELENKVFVEIDTAFYFFATSLYLFSWSLFVARYLSLRPYSRRILMVVGLVLFLGGITLVIVNFFTPVLFSYRAASYTAEVARDSLLITQMSMFAVTGFYALAVFFIRKDWRRRQYLAIAASALAMAAALLAQFFNPLVPFYAIGCLASVTMVHAFVTLSEREELNASIKKGLEREKQQAEQIYAMQEIAYTDSLTGAKNKHAYVEFEAEIDKRIREKTIQEFCLFLFDLNDLKLINDTYGHETGDKYIVKSCEIIERIVPHTHFYRYGGDEFVAFLEGEDYVNRFKILDAFNAYIDENIRSGEPIISAGFADFVPELDNTLSVVFARADEKMYQRKKVLKGLVHPSQGNVSLAERPYSSIRMAMYETFYYSDKISLIDVLNASSCDDILEVDTNADTYRQIFHVEGKYTVPDVSASYRDLNEFTLKHVVHPEDAGAYQNLMKPEGFFERLSHATIPNFDFGHFRYKIQGGDYRYVEQVVITGKENGLAEGVFRVYLFDISSMKLRQLGAHSDENAVLSLGRDAMTGLWTGKDFFSRGDELVKSRSDVQWCLVAIDIEHFKFFSEWFGRKKGNVLLASLGAELAEEEKALGGLGGYFGQDDYALLMPFDEKKIEALFERIKSTIHSFDLTGGLLPAFGVAKLEKRMTVADAFDHASVATSKAKADIATRICYYNSDMQFLAEQEYLILTNFANALRNDEITFYLQPQCRISTGAIVGAEALVRWIRKDGSMVYPDKFVPVLEKYGFITDLDKFLWEKVVAWIASHVREGKDIVPISVNVSRVDIFNLDLAPFFHDLCEKYKVPHKLLKLEITESSYAETTSTIDELVRKLREDDFVVMMDDFGSGYSSLNMLSSLKLDAIKMDARFLQIDQKSVDKGVHILESVINMTKTMALPIVVEGVETKEQTEFLADLGCRYAQGYYFYKPMSIEKFEAIIADKKKIDHRGILAKANDQFRIREFLDKNIYSDSMLNNVLGPVAIYSLTDEHVDIVRYNEQFYKAVNVPDFTERLVNIEQFVPEPDVPVLFNTMKEAKNNKLLGASGMIRFMRTNGTMSYFDIHFYYLGRKEGADQFYGSAHDLTELLDAVEEKKLIAEFSTDNIVFINKIDDKWHYGVASNGMASIFGLTAAELEEELNSGDFTKRLVATRDLRFLMAEASDHAAKGENFEKTLRCHDKNHRVISVLLTFTYVNEKTSNVVYVMMAKILEEAK